MDGMLWIKRFKHQNKYYCYDLGVNTIMEVDQVLYQEINKFGLHSNQSLTSRKEDENEKILKARAIIKDYQTTKGGFISCKNIKLRFPFKPEEYEKLLGNLINHMILNITEKCNMRCRYCRSTVPTSLISGKPRTMSWTTAKNAIDYFISHASHIIEKTDRDLVIGFYGGEPLLEANKIFKVISYIEDEYSHIFPRFRFSLTTNGTLFTEEIIRGFIKYGFNLLVSLDGPQELHDRYRLLSGGKGSHQIVQKNLALIDKIDDKYFCEKVGFSIVLSPEYRLKDVYYYFKEFCFSPKRAYMLSQVEGKWTHFFDKFRMKEESIKLKVDEKDLLKKYLQNKTEGVEDALLDRLFEGSLLDIHERIPTAMPDEIYPNGICLPGLHKLFVGADGDFHLCEKTGNNHSIGNLKGGFEIEKIFSLIDGYIQITHQCRNCWAIRLCKDCYLSALSDDGYSKNEKKQSCRRRKSYLMRGLINYVDIMEKNPQAFGERTYDQGIIVEAFNFLGRQ